MYRLLSVLLLSCKIFIWGYELHEEAGSLSHFESYLREFNISIPSVDFERRMHIFSENVEYIARKNREQGPMMKITQFTHITGDEFLELYAGEKTTTKYEGADEVYPVRCDNVEGYVYCEASKGPDTVDWRNTGAVSAVKDQGITLSLFTHTHTYIHTYIHTHHISSRVFRCHFQVPRTSLIKPLHTPDALSALSLYNA